MRDMLPRHELALGEVVAPGKTADDGTLTTFASGATRDTSVGKLDYEGFLSPLVVERFARYMDKHRTQSNGELRDADNWQGGFPRSSYMKSLWRHFMDLWLLHRGRPAREGVDLEEALCACLFNVQGYLHEVLIGRSEKE